MTYLFNFALEVYKRTVVWGKQRPLELLDNSPLRIRRQRGRQLRNKRKVVRKIHWRAHRGKIRQTGSCSSRHVSNDPNVRTIYRFKLISSMAASKALTNLCDEDDLVELVENLRDGIVDLANFPRWDAESGRSGGWNCQLKGTSIVGGKTSKNDGKRKRKQRKQIERSKGGIESNG